MRNSRINRLGRLVNESQFDSNGAVGSWHLARKEASDALEKSYDKLVDELNGLIPEIRNASVKAYRSLLKHEDMTNGVNISKNTKSLSDMVTQLNDILVHITSISHRAQVQLKLFADRAEYLDWSANFKVLTKFRV